MSQFNLRNQLFIGFVILFAFNNIQLKAQSSERKPLADISETSFIVKGERFIIPKKYRTLGIDKVAMQDLLLTAPDESPSVRQTSTVIFEMPMPDGTAALFRIYTVPVMSPELAAKFPEIKTYAGQRIDDPSSTIRLDMTPLGFHAMVLSPRGQVFIDPYSSQTTDEYICYFKSDLQRTTGFICESEETSSLIDLIPPASGVQKTSGAQLRTYRLALACTGEYAATKGGTVPGALAGMTTTMNRVNGVYETEVAIRMIMVANNNLLIYTNSSTDPYTNGNGSTMLSQNVSTCNSVIGSSNYDIGHVFSTGGGGIAGLGVVCGSNKAYGVTGSANPVGDPFDIDYVAHEMGHQFGGNHTFNGVTGSCNGNRAASAAYEPGSGITIMAYAGICGTDNLASNSIAYFHVKSFDEIVNFSTTGNGNTCPVTTNTNNNPPVVTSMGSNYAIPISTPFVLTGAATDANGNPLTYSWEQYDLGSAGAWNANLGNAPIFRPFIPVTSPSRTFPKLSDIINNTTTIGEILPNVARTMHFQLSVRDNQVGGGGFTHPDSTVTISVINGGGAFAVTAPNTAVSWNGGSNQNVTWNVSGTTASPISTANVKISLSTDGGNTFPTIILASTPNDGTQSIVIPNVATSQARIKIEAVGNIFFDMSNTNFTITSSAFSSITTSAISPLSYCAGASLNVSFTTNGAANAGNVFTAQLSNASGSFVSPVSIGTLSSVNAGTISCVIPAGTSGGSGYRIRVVSSNPVVTGSDNGSNLVISGQVGAASAPQSGSNTWCANFPVIFTVSAITNATTYNWNVTAGGMITSGQGTSQVTIVFPPGFPTTSATVSVFGSNSNCTGNSNNTTVTIMEAPDHPMANPASGCEGTPINLSGTPLPGLGQTGIFSENNPYTGPSTSFTYSLMNSNGCYSTSTFATITVNPLPVGVTFGGLAASYNITASPALLTGTPAGGTFSGPGITGNTFTPSAAGVGGPYTIIYTYTNGNGCSNSSSQTTSVANCTLPATPSAITTVGGTAKVCPGTTKTYSVTNNATLTYTWTPPTGGTITNGQGTNQVTINYTAGFVAAGPLTVVANNACGSSPVRSLTINRNNPPTPSVITGATAGLCGLTGVPYSVNLVSNVTYNWTLSVPIANVATGQGTNAITANFLPGYTSGSLRVTTSNACGTSAVRSLTIKTIPAVPATITGPATVCQNQFGVPYSIAPVPSATSYKWNVPSGARINDGSVTSTSSTLITTATAVTVNFAITSGNVRVLGTNACGSSSYKSLAVTFNCRIANTAEDLKFYPVPAHNILNIEFESASESNYGIRLINLLGKVVLVNDGSSVIGTNYSELSLEGINPGVYFLEVVNGDQRKLEKVIVE